MTGNDEVHSVTGVKVEESQDERIAENLFRYKRNVLVTSEHRLKYSILGSE